jgi:hypothetical protein
LAKSYAVWYSQYIKDKKLIKDAGDTGDTEAIKGETIWTIKSAG